MRGQITLTPRSWVMTRLKFTQHDVRPIFKARIIRFCVDWAWNVCQDDSANQGDQPVYKPIILTLLLSTSALAQTYQGGPQDVASVTINRNANYTGGTPGWVNNALRVNDTVGAQVQAFEWAILGHVESASPNSQVVGVYGQSVATAQAATVWGGVSEARDQTGPNGSVGASAVVVGHEIDAVGGARAIGLDVVMWSPPPGAIGERIGCPDGQPCPIRVARQIVNAQPCDMTKSPIEHVQTWDTESPDRLDGEGRCSVGGVTYWVRKIQGQIVQWCAQGACH